MTDKKITAPGIYAVTCKWAKLDSTKAKRTPYYSLLFVSEEHGKIYATIWNSDGHFMPLISQYSPNWRWRRFSAGES
jgi:hypothetical protein